VGGENISIGTWIKEPLAEVSWLWESALDHVPG
jgi:hypothetical protein